MRSGESISVWPRRFGLHWFSVFPRDNELALVLVIPHTTAIRGNRWEVSVAKRFLKPGVFHLQQIQPIPLARLDIKLGDLTSEELQVVRQQLAQLLNL